MSGCRRNCKHSAKTCRIGSKAQTGKVTACTDRYARHIGNKGQAACKVVALTANNSGALKFHQKAKTAVKVGSGEQRQRGPEQGLGGEIWCRLAGHERLCDPCHCQNLVRAPCGPGAICQNLLRHHSEHQTSLSLSSAPPTQPRLEEAH